MLYEQINLEKKLQFLERKLSYFFVQVLYPDQIG